MLRSFLGLESKTKVSKRQPRFRFNPLEQLDDRVVPTAASAVVSAGSLGGMQQLYAANNNAWTFDTTWNVDNSASIPVGSFDRVAYFVELGPVGNTKWVWASFDTFSTNPVNLRTPNFGIFQPGTLVNNIKVEGSANSGVTPITTSGRTGIIEFWNSNYNQNGGGLYGSNNGYFDWKDGGGGTGGGHGAFEVHAFTDGTLTLANCIFGVHRGGGSGIGNQNTPGTGDTDWTFGPTGIGSYAIRNLEIWVGKENLPPTMANIQGDVLVGYAPGSGDQVIDQGTPAVVNDPAPVGPNAWNTGKITVSITSGGVPTDDVLTVRNQGNGAGQVGFSAGTVSYEGVAIGTTTGGTGGTNLVVTFNASATTASVSAVLQNIAYNNSNLTTVPTARNLSFTVTDGDGLNSTVSTASISMNVGGTVDELVWDNDAGDNDFANPLNWVGDAKYPDTNDIAIFRTAGAGVVDVGTRYVGGFRFDGSGNFTLQNGSVTLASLNVQAGATGTKTITANLISTALVGTVSGGTLDLANTTNGFTSASTFTVGSGATLRVAGDAAQGGAGSATLTLNGGTLIPYGFGTFTPTNTLSVQSNSTLTVDASLSSITYPAISGFAGGAKLTITSAQPVTFSSGVLAGVAEFDHTNTLRIGNISGASGGLTNSGGGLMELTGTNTYGGPTNATAGTIRLFTPVSTAPVMTGLTAWFDAQTLPVGTATTWAETTANGNVNDHPAAAFTGGTVTVAADGPNGMKVVHKANGAYADVTGNLVNKEQYLVFRSPTPTWTSNYGAVFGRQGDDRASSYLFENNTTYFHSNQYPAAVSKNGTSITSGNFDFGTINQYMVVKITVNSGNLAPALFRIGGQSGWLASLDIAEILVYDTALNSADEATVGGYLAAKYGISTTYVITNTNIIPDGSAVSITGTGVLDINGKTETIGSLSGDATGTLLVGAGNVTANTTTPSNFAGTTSIANGGSFSKQGTAAQTLSGPIVGTSSSVGSIGVNSNAGTLNVNGGINLQYASVNFGGAGSIVVNSAITGNGGVITSNGIQHYGYHANDDANYLNLNNNGGMLNNPGVPNVFSPTTKTAFRATSILTAGPGSRGLDFNDDNDFINTGNIGQVDNYSNLFLTKLTVTPANAGVWTFRLRAIDDANGVWIDLNQNGIFGTAGGGLGTNGGGSEQLAYNDGGVKSVTLAAGDYWMAFTHRESGGGSQIEVGFTCPTIPVETIIQPLAPAQAGMWNVNIPVFNSVSKSGSGTVTLLGANSYNGSTTVTAGQLLLGANDVLPDTTAVAVNGATASLGLGAFSDTVTGVQLVSGSITGSSGVLTSTTNYDLQNGSVSAILAGNVGIVKSSLAAVTLSGANTYTGDTVVSAGAIVQGAAGTIPSGPGFGNVVVNGIVEMNGINMTVNGLSGSGTVRSTYPGNVTLTVGNNDQSASFSGVISNSVSAPVTGIRHYGYHANDDANYLNLNNNGGMFNGGQPTTKANFYNTSILTAGPGGRGLDFNDDNDFIATGNINQADNYSNLFLTTLRVTPANAGTWTFRLRAIDDANGIWIDLNQNGIFGTAGGTLATGGGGSEQLAYNDGGTKSVTLAAGDYLMAFTHRESGGGSQIEVGFTSPTIPAETIIQPLAPAQAGMWWVPVFDPSAGPGGGIVNLQKIGTGTQTLSGANTYSGSTTVTTGTLKLGPNAPASLRTWTADSVAGSTGTSVGTWTDSVASKAATTNNAPPTLVTGAMNGHNALAFNGSQALQIAAGDNPISGATAFTVSVVFKPTANGAGGAAQWYNNSGLVDGEQGGVTNDWGLAWNGSGQVGAGIGSPDVTRYSNPITLNNTHVAIYSWSAASQLMTLNVDGVVYTQAATASAARNSYQILIGRLNATNNYFTGQISDVRIYNTALSTTAINNLGAYLSSTYGATTTFSGTSTNVLPATTAVSVASGAALDIGGTNQTVASLTGAVASSLVTATNGIINVAGSTTTTFDGDIAGTGSLVRSGTGTLILTGANTYTGTTTISSGTLQVDGVHTSTAAITATGTGSFVGTGIVSGSLTVGNVLSSSPLSVDGTVDPGVVGGTGILYTGSVNFTANLFTRGTLGITLNGNSPGSFDQLSVNGDVTLGNPGANFYPILNLNPVTGLPTGDHTIDYTIIDNVGANPVVGHFAGLASGSLFSVNGQTFSITYTGGDGNDVVLTNYGSANTFYVDSTFSAGNPNITDADPVAAGNQPAIYGVSAFSTVNAAIAAATTGATIIVNPGVYHEAVDANKTLILYLQQVVSAGTPVVFDSLQSPSAGVSPIIQLNNGVNLTVGDATSTSLYAPINGVGSFTKTGSGTLTTFAINGYNGTTSITGNGALRTGVSFALPGSTIDIGASAKLQLGGINQSVSSLAGTGTIENASATDATLTIGNGNVNVSFAGSLADGAGGGKLLLSKIGTGTFTLSGSSSYTGDTTVTGGILRANATNAFSPNTAFNVTSPGKVQLFGFNNTILSAPGTGVIENGAATAATLTVDSSSNTTISGLLQNGGTGTLALTKAGTGTLVLTNTNTYTGGTTVSAGILQVGAATTVVGTGSLSVGAAGTFQLAGYNVTVRNLTGSGLVENAAGTPATLSVFTTSNSTFSGVIQDGTGGGALNLSVSNASPFTPGFYHAGFARDNGDANFDLNNNGGMFNALPGNLTVLRPETRPSFLNKVLTTAALNYADETALLADGAVVGLTDNYNSVWYGYLVSSEIGNWQFQRGLQDDWTGMWIDINQDGILQSTTAGLGSDRGEQLAYNDGNVKTVNLTNPLGQGYYLVAFTHLEGGGGANASFSFKSPSMSALTIINPGDAAQQNLWSATIPNLATLTLSGNNTYTGSTTVNNGGILVAASNTALGGVGSGTTVLTGGSLGFSNNVTVAETVTANGAGLGLSTAPGAVYNVSGTNSLTTTLNAGNTFAGTLGVGSVAGTLTLADINLDKSNLIFAGAGNLVVSGVISGSGSNAAPATLGGITSGLAIWLDATDIDADGNPDALANNASITNWKDKSGNNRNFSEVLGNGARYVDVSNSNNGQPTVSFDGGGALSAGTAGNNNPRNFLNANGQFTLISVARYSGSDRERVIGARGAHNWLYGFHGTGTSRWHYDNWGSLDVDGLNSNTNWHLHANQMNLTNVANNPAGNFWKNGVLLTAAGTGTADGRNNNVPDGIELGAYNGLNETSTSQVSELIMYDRVLTNEELLQVELYLNYKYNQTFNSAALNQYSNLNSVTKNGSGTVRLNGANTYSGTTTVNAGALIAGNDAALGATTAGTTVASGGSLGLDNNVNLSSEPIVVSGVGAAGQPGALFNAGGSNTVGTITTTSVVNAQLGIGSTSGTLTVNGNLDLKFSHLVFNGAGNVIVNGVIDGFGISQATGIRHYGYHANDDANYLNLNNNGGMLNNAGVPFAFSPTTKASFVNTSILTAGPGGRGLDFNDDNDFIATGNIGQADNYSNLFLTTLHVTPANAGVWTFRHRVTDDANGTWIDLNQNGIFGTAGGGLGTGGGGSEQLSYNDTGVKSVTLAAGDYLMAFTHRESGGGSQIEVGFTCPTIATETIIQPLAPAQAGMWLTLQGSLNTVTKNGTGVVTLNGANNYKGATTVNAGTLVAGNALALGTTDTGTTVATGGTLGFQGDITLAGEVLTVNKGTGASGQPGALVNISGNNTIAVSSSIIVPVAINSQLSIGSIAGSLTINPDIDLKLSRLVVDGSGTVIMNGAVGSSTPIGSNDPTQRDIILGYNPLSFWEFNQASGTAALDSGTTNTTGTLTGAATRSTGRTGQAGDYALDVRAGGSVTTVVTNQYNSISTNNKVTLGFWLYQDPAAGGRNNTTFQALSGGTRVAFTHAHWGDNNIYWDAGQGERVNGAVPFANYTDGWHHYILTKSSSGPNYQAIYRDGVLLVSGTGSQTFATINSLTIAPDYRGQLDDVFLLNTALTQAQVTALYAARNAAGVLPSDNQLVKNGSGTLQLNGANTYVGATTIADGRLQVNGTISSSSAITVSAVGVLEGHNGTVSSPTEVGGTLGAGAGTGTGKVSMQDFHFVAGGKNRFDIRGTTQGATSNGYDQIEVAGTANLANATLEVTLGGYVPTATPFTIMTTTGGGTITGTFDGLPEGATVTATDSAQTFIVNYTSTSVTLTATVGGTGPSLVSVTANGVTAGDPHPYGPHALVDVNQPSGYYTFSRILSLDLTFDTNIGTIDAGAFTLTSGAFTLTSGAEVSTSVLGNVVTLNFNAAAGVEFGSLETGIWILTTDLTKVQSSSNVAGTGTVTTDDGGGNGIIRRLFGDINGDGQVDSGDFGVFGATFGLNSSDPNFEAQFDVDGNGDIDSGDFGAFGARFGTGL